MFFYEENAWVLWNVAYIVIYIFIIAPLKCDANPRVRLWIESAKANKVTSSRDSQGGWSSKEKEVFIQLQNCL